MFKNKYFNQNLKASIFESVTETMMQHEKTIRNDKIDSLVKKNNKLIDDPKKALETVGFYYRGQVFDDISGMIYPKWLPRIPLHISLYSEMNDILDKDYITQKELRNIKNYLRKVFTLCNTYSDFIKVLPNSFHKIFDDITKDFDYFSDVYESKSISQKKIDKFFKENYESSELFKRYLLKRVLLNEL